MSPLRHKKYPPKTGTVVGLFNLYTDISTVNSVVITQKSVVFMFKWSRFFVTNLIEESEVVPRKGLRCRKETRDTGETRDMEGVDVVIFLNTLLERTSFQVV